MKSHNWFSALAFMLLCQGAFAQGGKYTVTGILPDKSLDGKKVMMVENTAYNAKEDPVRCEAEVNGGRFVIEGQLSDSEPLLARVAILGDTVIRTIVNIIIEPGDITIKYNGRFDFTVSGTPLNDEFYSQVTAAYNSQHGLYDRTAGIRAARAQAMRDSTWTREDDNKFWAEYNAMRGSDDYDRNLRGFVDKYIEKHPRMVVSYVDQFWRSDRAAYHDFVSRIAEPYRTRLTTGDR